jgi:energy-coupling factor transport system ATP-binding protein
LHRRDAENAEVSLVLCGLGVSAVSIFPLKLGEPSARSVGRDPPLPVLTFFVSIRVNSWIDFRLRVDRIVEIHGLTYAYRGRSDRPALRGIDLDIRRGEFLALAGRTGSGKSTLCYTLNGLIPNSFGGEMEGSVRVCGLDARQASVADLARTVGLVLQSAESQIVGLTVEEDVQFGLENIGLPPDEIVTRADQALETVRLAACAARSPWTLSGGQKQRLAIAAALAFRPELLVLDNPTAELDPVGKHEVLDTLACLNREHGITIVIVDQELHEVIPFASRLALLDEGRLALIGSPAEVLDRADVVRGIGVKLPDVTEVAYQLRKAGRWQGPLPISVESARAHIQTSEVFETSEVWRAPDSSPHAPTESEILIQVDDLRFAYPGGPEALDGITLTVRRGEFVAVMGQNGAGKTTLAKHFNGLLKPTAGCVRVDGIDTRERSVAQLATRVGYVFQNPDHQIFSQTVAQELAFGPKNLGWPQPRIDEAVARTLADIGMAGQGQAEPVFMGLAERKLIAIGSVLIMEPELLVLDEPATGADYSVALRIMRYVSELHRRGLTIVMITHDVSLAANYADRLLVMHDGRIALDGPPRVLFRDPDALQTCSIAPPQVSRLARSLNGLGLQSDIVRVNELVYALTGGSYSRPMPPADESAGLPNEAG